MNDHAHPDSAADQLRGYSFLHLFAHDGLISKGEVEFMAKLAMRDGEIDDEEREALQLIVSRIPKSRAAEDAWPKLVELCEIAGVEPNHDA